MGKWSHRISDGNINELIGTCSTCGPNTPVRYRKDRGHWICKNQDSRKSHYSPAHAVKPRLREWVSQREALAVVQEGLCAICGKASKLALDHCHITNANRGALCIKCNSGLGMFNDDPEVLAKAISYLKHHCPDCKPNGLRGAPVSASGCSPLPFQGDVSSTLRQTTNDMSNERTDRELKRTPTT